MATVPLKRCTRCKKELPATLEFFGKHGRDGLQWQCKPCVSAWHKEHKQKLRLAVIAYYSNGEMQCACCGETEIKFLSVDHIDGGGRKHRQDIKNNHITSWLIKNNYPEGYQILCHNCNMARGLYGTCPHQEVDS